MRNDLLKLKTCLLIAFLIFSGSRGYSQQGIIINLAPIDGVEITPDNILNFIVQSDRTTSAIIKGAIRYRNSGLTISYQFNYTVHQGINNLVQDGVHPQWQFSSGALQELFLNYKKLPEGTYEYCVTITPTAKLNSEQTTGDTYNECLYHKSDDLFLINLVDPENDAKIYEYYPTLSWAVTYPFASALTYRVRVAPILNGQNPQNAITRNNPVFDESNVMGTSIVYPVYAKPLEKFQPYAWTVDAYYKGILIGGAETWKFTIIEDSLLKGISPDQSYIELNIEKGMSQLYAVGELKLKYIESEHQSGTLHFTLTDENGKIIKLPEDKWAIIRGDNRTILKLDNVVFLKHYKNYHLTVATETGTNYNVNFKYINPNYIK